MSQVIRYIRHSAALVLIVSLALLTALLLLTSCSAGSNASFTVNKTTGEAPFIVEFINTSQNANHFFWDFGDGESTTTTSVDDPVTHEYTKSGIHTITLIASKETDNKNGSTATTTIEVIPGPIAKIAIQPSEIMVEIEESITVSAEATDKYDNPVADVELSWDIYEEAGAISNGLLTVGTKAGEFQEALTVTAVKNETSVKTSATVMINPGTVESMAISPTKVPAGSTTQLEIVGADKYGNPVSDTEVAGTATWHISHENIGTLTPSGLLIASEVAQISADAIQATVTQDGEEIDLLASITIIPGPLDQVVIAPNPAEIGIEMTQQFVAVGADNYGNRISGLDVTWSVEEPDAGSIDQSGLFQAGSSSDTYNNAIKAETSYNGIVRSGVASVTVEPDRIVFLSVNEDGLSEIYIMDIDGNNIEEIMTDQSIKQVCSWSPDGRRIVYDYFSAIGGICAVNDDGDWNQLIIEPGTEGENIIFPIFPSLSPDGTKIAYIQNSINVYDVLDGELYGEMDIYISDIDGGNITQITATSDGNEWVPSWSPAGNKLVYDFTPEGENGDIYVIDTDGNNIQRITTNQNNDTGPKFSPNGDKIVFYSDRDGDNEIYVIKQNGTGLTQLTTNVGKNDLDPEWSPDGTKILFVSNRDSAGDKFEIYQMNSNGSNVKRLTNDSALYRCPAWAPRKQGALVNAASVIIPNASTLENKTVQELTSSAREAVVRIKTDIGSGTGFIIDSDGTIVTNNHVVRDVTDVTVYLNDKTSYPATIVKRDMIHDIAVIKINAENVHFLEFGDLSQVGLGQQVFVLGYPLDAKNISVTSGLISSIDYDSGRNITWIQTDSAVNPGNSGGPLLDLQGKVIGVVSVKMVGVGIEGIGFAISTNTVNTYAEELGLTE